MATYISIWLLTGFATAIFLIWSSGDDIKIGDIFFAPFFSLTGPLIAFAILGAIIKESKFWKITIYRRKRAAR